ncbi:hypothetical protein GOODEAATRI_017678, partial [Goodea atripinnis]
EKVAKAQEVKDLAMSSLAQAVEDEKKEQWRVEGRSMLFDAKRNLHRRMEQEHMINWVEKSVIGSITPQQEKESIAKCIADLKALAKTTQAKATV